MLFRILLIIAAGVLGAILALATDPNPVTTSGHIDMLLKVMGLVLILAGIVKVKDWSERD